MFKQSLIAVAIALGMLASSQVMAAPFDNGLGHIHRMQDEQARMIDDGIRRGELTPREANRLNEEQGQIRDTEWRYDRDGRLSSADISTLEDMLYRADRHIRYDLNNAEWARVPAPAPGFGLTIIAPPLIIGPHHHMGHYH